LVVRGAPECLESCSPTTAPWLIRSSMYWDWGRWIPGLAREH